MNWKGPDFDNPCEGPPADADPEPVAIVKDDLRYNDVEAYAREGLSNQHKGNHQGELNELHKLKVCDKLKHDEVLSEGDHSRTGRRITSSATMKH